MVQQNEKWWWQSSLQEGWLQERPVVKAIIRHYDQGPPVDHIKWIRHADWFWKWKIFNLNKNRIKFCILCIFVFICKQKILKISASGIFIRFIQITLKACTKIIKEKFVTWIEIACHSSIHGYLRVHTYSHKNTHIIIYLFCFIITRILFAVFVFKRKFQRMRVCACVCLGGLRKTYLIITKENNNQKTRLSYSRQANNKRTRVKFSKPFHMSQGAYRFHYIHTCVCVCACAVNKTHT